MSGKGDEKVKRPAFQFYPGDWLRSTDLRSCSLGARGLWIDMICLMHEGTPYGHLRVNQKVIQPSNLARIVGATLGEVEGWLHELESAGVCSKDDEGCYLSRRMIRDEHIRQVRADAGKKGGNPNLKKKAESPSEVGEKVNQTDKQNPTPAFASSSASAEKVSPIGDTAREQRSKPVNVTVDHMVASCQGLTAEVATEYLAYRQKKRAFLTARAWKDITSEIHVAGQRYGLSPDDVLSKAMSRGWQGFEADWLKRDAPSKPGATSKHDLSQMDYSKGVTHDGRF